MRWTPTPNTPSDVLEDRRISPDEERRQEEEDALLRLMFEPLGMPEQTHMDRALPDKKFRAGDFGPPQNSIIHGDYTEPGIHGAEDKFATVEEGPDRGVWSEWDPDDFAPAKVLEDGSARPVDTDSQPVWYHTSDDPTMGADDPRMEEDGLLRRLFRSTVDPLLTFGHMLGGSKRMNLR